MQLADVAVAHTWGALVDGMFRKLPWSTVATSEVIEPTTLSARS